MYHHKPTSVDLRGFFTIIRKRKTNIIVILTDDQGWADVGFNGCTDIPTPHLDRLAGEGVVFSNGYVSHPYCSPSRAGLLTGRYQARFGHDCNMPYTTDNENNIGIPLSETLISERVDISNDHPDIMAALERDFQIWDQQNLDPAWLDPHMENVLKEEKKFRAMREKAKGPSRKN